MRAALVVLACYVGILGMLLFLVAAWWDPSMIPAELR